jgi:hypothetical protein
VTQQPKSSGRSTGHRRNLTYKDLSPKAKARIKVQALYEIRMNDMREIEIFEDVELNQKADPNDKRGWLHG